MNIEELVYTSLTTDPALAAKLVTFNSKPAVFERDAAAEKHPLWGSAARYPSIVFWTTMNEDPAKNTIGTLTVDVAWPDAEWMSQDVEAKVRNVLHGAILVTSDGPVACLWASSSWGALDDPRQKQKIDGGAMTFDLVALPAQTTFSPDPVAGLYAETRAILGEDGAFFLDSASPGIIHPLASKPAIWWQLVSFSASQITNAGTWIDGIFACHIIAPSAQARLNYARKLHAALANRGRVKYSATMAIFVRSLSETAGLHPIKQGQLVLAGRWLEPRASPEAVPLQHIYINYEEV